MNADQHSTLAIADCCEFAVTSHNFTINGDSYVVTFSEAGDEFGCANKVSQGVEPNEVNAEIAFCCHYPDHFYM